MTDSLNVFLLLALGMALSAYDALVGELLRDARQRARIEVKQLAASMRVDDSTVRRWEYGDQKFGLSDALRLPGPVREEFGELIAPHLDILNIPRAAFECFARLIHTRPRPVRARLAGQAESKEALSA